MEFNGRVLAKHFEQLLDQSEREGSCSHQGILLNLGKERDFLL